MSDTALVKRPVGDDLAIKVKAYKDEQVANREKEEAPFKRRVLIESFLRLSYRYFGLPREFIKNLSKDERAELLKKVFQEAKMRLWWQLPLIHSLALTVVGALFIFGVYNNKKANFPAFKLRRLYKWYMENYGADDLEKAVKSGDFDGKTIVNIQAGDSIKTPESSEIVFSSTLGLQEGVLEANESAVSSIGFNPVMLLEKKLSKFFMDNKIKVFNISDADLYLRAKSGRQNWWWRPLREKDILKYRIKGKYENYHDYGYYNSENWDCRPYSKLIPPNIHGIIRAIVGEFGDKVHFLASCYTDNQSDHFIAAEALDMPLFIFGLWHDDELKQPDA